MVCLLVLPVLLLLTSCCHTVSRPRFEADACLEDLRRQLPTHLQQCTRHICSISASSAIVGTSEAQWIHQSSSWCSPWPSRSMCREMLRAVEGMHTLS